MKIVFVSVVLNIHQVGVADRLFEITNGNFKFIETGIVSELDKKGGDNYSSRPYFIRANDIDSKEVLALIESADVMIYDAAPLKYLRHRTKTNKLTFILSERWLKRGFKNILSPRLLKQQWFYHIYGHGKPLYALCASAYAAKDFHLLHSFRNKCYKWGYFPLIPNFNFYEKIGGLGDNYCVSILWAGRFIQWKHPEMMISLAKKLKFLGLPYQITMIGDGALRPQLESEVRIHHLHIEFIGSIPNNNVQEIMRRHHIFCFTSDRQEGWGAVLNEAMGNGCCPVASSEAGATHFLVKDDYNGCIFTHNRTEEFQDKVISLIKDENRLTDMRRKAAHTIHELWNAVIAADNLLQLSTDILNERMPSIADGPCSKAEN